jgi:hypothetical protein
LDSPTHTASYVFIIVTGLSADAPWDRFPGKI